MAALVWMSAFAKKKLMNIGDKRNALEYSITYLFLLIIIFLL